MSFEIRTEQLNSIINIVDKFEWNDGEKIAFVDFNGIKNIPIYINDEELKEENNEVKSNNNLYVEF